MVIADQPSDSGVNSQEARLTIQNGTMGLQAGEMANRRHLNSPPCGCRGGEGKRRSPVQQRLENAVAGHPRPRERAVSVGIGGRRKEVPVQLRIHCPHRGQLSRAEQARSAICKVVSWLRSETTNPKYPLDSNPAAFMPSQMSLIQIDAARERPDLNALPFGSCAPSLLVRITERIVPRPRVMK